MDRNRQASKERVKVAHLDFTEHRKTISRYINAKAMYTAYSVKLNHSPTIIKVLSLGMNAGTKDLNIDLKTYEQNKLNFRKEVRDKLTEIFKSGKSCLPVYIEYIKQLNTKSKHYANAMKEIRDEIMKHNQSEVNVAGIFGRIYLGLKLSSDVASKVISSLPGPANQAYGFLYTMATETASTVADAKNANVWSFQGSLSQPYIMAWDEVGKKALKSSTKMRVVRGAYELADALVYAVEFNQKWQSFK